MSTYNPTYKCTYNLLRRLRFISKAIIGAISALVPPSGSLRARMDLSIDVPRAASVVLLHFTPSESESLSLPSFPPLPPPLPTSFPG